MAVEKYTPIQTASPSQMVDITAAVGLTSIPTNATAVLLQVEGDNVRYSIDGSTPTTSTGMRLLVGADPILVPFQPGIINVIEEGTAAKLNITYLKDA